VKIGILVFFLGGKMKKMAEIDIKMVEKWAKKMAFLGENRVFCGVFGWKNEENGRNWFLKWAKNGWKSRIYWILSGKKRRKWMEIDIKMGKKKKKKKKKTYCGPSVLICSK
jgi:hypothetical protein